MRSVDEKVQYNEKRGGKFGTAYVFGVTVYRTVFKNDPERARRIIDEFHEMAAKEGNATSKGFMCGVRDAANERKAKQRGK